jgi:hypothetical protein
MERVEDTPTTSIPSQKKGWGESAYRQIFGSTIRELFGMGPKCGYVTVRIYGVREKPVYEVFVKHPNEKVEHLHGLNSLDLKKILLEHCPKYKGDVKKNERKCNMKCIENCSIQVYDYITLREFEESIGRENPVF